MSAVNWINLMVNTNPSKLFDKPAARVCSRDSVPLRDVVGFKSRVCLELKRGTAKRVARRVIPTSPDEFILVA